MKNFVIAVVTAVILVLAAFFIVGTLSSAAERKALNSFGDAEPEETFMRRYPAVLQKNPSAVRLEELAAALQLDLRSKQAVARWTTSTDDAGLMGRMATWLKTQHEEPNDEIAPLPADAGAWLNGRRAELDAVARHLVTAEIPRWPMSHQRPRSEQPLPNLLSHMKLARLLSVAALDAEAGGDHGRAWMLQHAAWKLAQGLNTRPELISQLIGVASVRLIAATARKLEPSVPAWFSEVAALQPRRNVYDGLRFEMAMTRRSLEEAPESILREDDGSSMGDRIGAVVMRPVFRWAEADATAATAAEFQFLRTIDPCTLDVAAVNKRVEARMSPLSRRFSRMMLPNLASAFSRAASVELAIEGTSNVLALKTERDAAGRWPDYGRGDGRSVCRGGRWVYSHLASGVPALQFQGARFTEAKGVGSTRVPFDYFGD